METSKEKDIEEGQAELDQINNLKAAAQKDLDSILASINSAKIQNEDESEKNKQLLVQRKDLVAQNNQLVLSTQDLQSKCNAIKDDIFEGDQRLKKVNLTIKAKLLIIDENNAKINDLKIQLSKVSQLIIDRQALIDSDGIKLSKDLKNIIDNNNQQISSIERELNDLKAKKSALQLSFATLQQDSKKCLDSLQESQAHLKNLQHDLNSKIKELNTALHNIDIAQSDVKHLNICITDLNKQKEMINGDIEVAQARLDTILTKGDILLNREAELNDRKEEILEKYKKLGAECSFSW